MQPVEEMQEYYGKRADVYDASMGTKTQGQSKAWRPSLTYEETPARQSVWKLPASVFLDKPGQLRSKVDHGYGLQRIDSGCGALQTT